ncbi:NUDIX hydrolase domain [Dillenia turbinata]|uniref:NUDIX hydrolase domain n=1 Tax=Dillenia turbinata TaxID=194707 RepID=A0AAN8VZF0_9MAGN
MTNSHPYGMDMQGDSIWRNLTHRCAIQENWGSKMLQNVAKQLEVYKPWNMEEKLEESCHDIVSDAPNNAPVGLRDNSNSFDKSCARKAAVLICIFEGHEGELRVILTKRSTKLSSHPGDVALPGGKMEEGDADDTETALREASEEIGLDPSLIQVVAHLEPFFSKNQLRVVPVVGLLDNIGNFKPSINIDEVDAIFSVPLEMFLKLDYYRYEERECKGLKYVLHLFDFESDQGTFLIWGLTASILIKIASIIYQRPPSFKELPDFQQVQRYC